ncbi:MAG: DUF116 domain-containing protein [Methanobacteriota archaeon]
MEQEVRVDFCDTSGIDINRRITGGGAIFFDESQLGWEIICDKQFFNLGIADVHFFERLCQPLISALRMLGVIAVFRPKNDIEVNGRKISGVGGTEDGDAFLFQGTILVDFDVNTMMRSLRIPIEKLKDKEIDSVKKRVTCLREELGYVPTRDDLKNILKESFEKIFSIKLLKRGLTSKERLLFEERKNTFTSETWINKIKVPGSEQPILSSVYKAKGGLIRTSLVVNLRSNRIRSTLITGDFFIYPKRAIFDLEAELKDTPTERKAIEEKITRFFKQHRPQILHLTVLDFVNAIMKALEKVHLTEFGIPLSLTNRIFMVNGSFREVAKKSPSHLLLPYCAKSLQCEYRYKKGCPECGECSIGVTSKLGKKKNMQVITIQSFEDLLATFKELKTQGFSSFIGCCCEAFYIKHFEDFQQSGLLAILVDIDSKTCYDLGKEQSAYQGNFESQTEVNIDLLQKVLNVTV